LITRAQGRDYTDPVVDLPAPHHWIIVADSPFLPARGGGELEHLGFVRTAVDAGVVAALVVPTDADPQSVSRQDDLPALRALVAPAPLITVPRRRSWRAAADPRHPYVVASRPAPPGLVDELREKAPQADAVVIYSYKAHEIGRIIAQTLGLPAVLRQHNLEGRYHQALAAAAAPPRSWAMRLEAGWIERDERRLERAPWLTGIADISMSDAAVRSKRASVPVEYVPTFALGPDAAGAATTWRPGGARSVVFLGALDVATNHDALTWFAGQVWPLVLREVPEARWQIVGRKPTPLVHQLVGRTEQAELHADVESPADYLSSAAVAINPAVSGSGVNIKLVEYLANGVPVLSTTRGMQGLGLVPDEDLAVEDDPAAFARRLVLLLTDSEEAARLAATGHAKALQILDTRTSLQQVTRLLTGSTA